MEIHQKRPRDETFETEVTSKSLKIGPKKNICNYLNPNIVSIITGFLDTKTYFTVIPLINKFFHEVISRFQYSLTHLSINYFKKVRNINLLLTMYNLQKLKVYKFDREDTKASKLKTLPQSFPWLSTLTTLTMNIKYTEKFERYIFSFVSLESLNLKITFSRQFLHRLFKRFIDQSNEYCQENPDFNEQDIQFQGLKVFHLKILRSERDDPNLSSFSVKLQNTISRNSVIQDFKISGLYAFDNFSKPDCLMQARLKKLDLRDCYRNNEENFNYFADYLKYNTFLEHLHISTDFILNEKAIEILNNKSSLKCLVLYCEQFNVNEKKLFESLLGGLKRTNIEMLSLKKFHMFNIVKEIKDLLIFSKILKKLEIYLDGTKNKTQEDLVRTIFEVIPYTNLQYFNKINLKKLLQDELEHLSYKKIKNCNCFFEDVLIQAMFNSKNLKTILFKDDDVLVLSDYIMQKHSFHNKFYLDIFRYKLCLSQLSKYPSQMQELNLVMPVKLDPFYLECIKKFTYLTKLSIENRKNYNFTDRDINYFVQLMPNFANLQELHILNDLPHYWNFKFEYFYQDFLPCLKKLSLLAFHFLESHSEGKIFTCLSRLSFLDLTCSIVTKTIFQNLCITITQNPYIQTLRLRCFMINSVKLGEDAENFNCLLESIKDKTNIKEFCHSPMCCLDAFFRNKCKDSIENVLKREKEYIEQNLKFFLNFEIFLRNNPRLKRLFIAKKLHYSVLYQFNSAILTFLKEQHFLEKQFQNCEKNANLFNMYRLRHTELGLRRNRIYYPFIEEKSADYAKKYENSEIVLITFIKKKKDLFMKKQIADLCADRQFLIISKTSNALKKLNGIYKIHTGIRLEIKTELSEFNPEAIVSYSAFRSVILMCACDILFMSLNFDAKTFNHEKTLNFNYDIIQNLKKYTSDADFQINHQFIRVLESFSKKIQNICMNGISKELFDILIQEKKIFACLYQLSFDFCICQDESSTNQLLEYFCNCDFVFNVLKFESFTWNFYELCQISETLPIENFSHCDLYFLVILLKNGYLRNVKTLKFFVTSENSIDELLFGESVIFRCSIFNIFLDLVDLETIKIEFPKNSQITMNYYKVLDFIQELEHERKLCFEEEIYFNKGEKIIHDVFVKFEVKIIQNELTFKKFKQIM